MYELEDHKQSILPILTKKLKVAQGDLDDVIRQVVIQFQGTLEFDDVMRDRLIDDLRTNFNTTASVPAVLKGKNGYVPWLDYDQKGSWRQWNRYKYYLRTVKGWSEPVIQSLDETSDQILDLLADPNIEDKPFDRRGLVMGYVQSGKTANFTAVINKAFDTGYKVIIVLAGLHNNLRSQTQIRLDEEVIGYTMKRKQLKERFVGVGLMQGYQYKTEIISLTNSDNDGDFSEKKAGTMFRPPILLVVKKNKTVLTNLLTYLQKKSQYAEWVEDKPHKVVKNLPLLIIDDEADQATVNTSDIYDDDDNIDPEYDPSTINGLIRDLFQTFEQRAYVGYTATPFANMLIDRDSSTDQHGYDLFPRDFIVGLPKPSNYSGPAEYFNIYDDADNQQASLIRHVHQDDNFIPIIHKKNHTPSYLPNDLLESICAFLIATAIRRLRGQTRKHSSMLVHVTRYTDVQKKVFGMIDEKIKDICSALRFGNGTTEHDALLQKNYKEFVYTSASRKDGGDTFNWDKVRQEAIQVLLKLEVKQINGNSTEVLDYDEHKDGHYVLAVGGDKLSRGLTLEGLTVSYYLRTSKVYDTLMQMGRWFGYRDGYFDLCRIYTTSELANWFYHIAIATDELRAQLVEISETPGMTPEKYVLEISMHPDMKITSPDKMRAARAVKVSYSASLVQTTVFENSRDFFNKNFNAVEKFIERLGGADTAEQGTSTNEPLDNVESVKRKGDDFYWEDVSSDVILFFLEHYQTLSSLTRVDTNSITEYILERNKDQELTNWTVVLINSGNSSERQLCGLNLKTGVKRKGEDYSPASSTLSIRILTSGGHEYLDYTLEQEEKVEEILIQKDEKTNRRREKANLYSQARGVRNEKKGLLLLYPLSTDSGGVMEEADKHLELNSNGIIPFGFAISFPKSTKASGDRDYIINKSITGEQHV